MERESLRKITKGIQELRGGRNEKRKEERRVKRWWEKIICETR